MKETRRVVSVSVIAHPSLVWFCDQVLKSLTKTQLSIKSSVGPSTGDTLLEQSEESEVLDQMWQMGQKQPLGLFYLATAITKFSLNY